MLNESYVEEDVFNALLELSYFRKASKNLALTHELGEPNTVQLPPNYVILPTLFLADAFQAYELLDSPYTNEIISLRKRIVETSVTVVGMGFIADSHYTAYIYHVGSSTVHYGDSLHGVPPSNMLSLLRWIFRGITEPIMNIKPGTIGLQRSGSGEGSCGIAAHNFIEIMADLREGVQPWRGPDAGIFRDAALEDLLRYNHAASQNVLEAPLDWCNLVQEDESEQSMLPLIAVSGFHNFNGYIPKVRSIIFCTH